MASINDLPAELILNIARYLDDANARRAWNHVGNFVLTNRKHHSVANSLLYSLAATYRFPVFWAAQNGMTTTLQMLLRAGAQSLGTSNWVIDRADFPTEYRVGLWAGRCQSVNTLIGVIDDDIDQREPEAKFCSRLRLSAPFLNRDTYFFADDGTVKAASRSEARLVGDYDQVTRRVYRGKQNTNVAWSPLHAAAANGHVETMEVLVKNGASIDDKSSGYCWCRLLPTWSEARAIVLDAPDGMPVEDLRGMEENAPEWTPLHHAICHGHVEAAIYLLKKGASCLETSQWSSSPGEYDDEDEVFGDHVSALHTASGAGCLEVVKHLIEEGYQEYIDVCDCYDMTPLHWACRNGRFTTAAWLVDHGADIDYILDDTRNTMLIDFIDHGLIEHAIKLVELGANPNVPGKNGATPLHSACGHCRLRTYQSKKDFASGTSQTRNLIERLLTAGANILATMTPNLDTYDTDDDDDQDDTDDKDEVMTPLEVACLHHNVVAVECLLSELEGTLPPDNSRVVKRCVQLCFEGRRGRELATSDLRIIELLMGYASGFDPPLIDANIVLRSVLLRPGIGCPSQLDLQMVRMLLTRGADFRYNETAGSAFYCFEVALYRRHFEVCDMMLRRGFDPTTDEIERFWLVGRELGSPDVLQYVLEINKHREVRDKLTVDATDLTRLLHTSSWEVDVLESFLQDRKLLDLSNSSIPQLNLALAKACQEQSAIFAKSLIAAGAEVNTPFSAGGPTVPLLIFVEDYNTYSDKKSMERKQELLSLILQSGADILYQADLRGVIDELQEGLLTHVGDGSVSTPLGYVIASRDDKALSQMFRHNPGMLGKDPRAAIAPYLHLAVIGGPGSCTDRIVAELVRNGANPMIRNTAGDIALAVLLNHYDVRPTVPLLPEDGELNVPRMVRMLWHDTIDINKATSNGLSLGNILAEMLQWQKSTMPVTRSKALDAQLKQLSLELGRHIQVTKIGDDKYSAQLRPIQETLSQRLVFHESLGD